MAVEVLGPDKGQQKEVRALNRVLRCNNGKGIEYEADPRHAEIMLTQLDLQDAKPAATPGSKEEGSVGD